MLGFLKKLLGFDQETMKAAGVQVEQAAYKVEPPLLDKVAAVNAQPIAKAVKPAAIKAAPKAAVPKKPAVKKEAAKKPATRGRKPKAK